MSNELISTVSGFTVERLRVFCRVAEAGSIVLAAKGDPTRQSQFSRQVKELEEFFGGKLIERAGHSIRLTENGARLAALTASYFRSIEELRAGAQQADELRIGAGESVFRWVLMPRLAELQSLAGTVRLEFFTRSTAQSVDAVKAGQIDLAIVRHEAADASLHALPCGRLAYALVVPKKLLTQKKDDDAHLPAVLPFALNTGDGVLTRGVLQLAERLKVKLDVRVRAESSNLLVSAIEHSELAAVIPAEAAEALPKGRFVTIQTSEASSLARQLSLIYSPHAASLRENLRRIAPRISSLFSN